VSLNVPAFGPDGRGSPGRRADSRHLSLSGLRAAFWSSSMAARPAVGSKGVPLPGIDLSERLSRRDANAHSNPGGVVVVGHGADPVRS
jgi:hypothetical protein